MNTQHRQLAHPATARPGFSLIEILVAVSIIVILVGIAGFAWSSMVEQGKVSSTKALLQQLQSIEAEYRIQAGSSHNHQVTPASAPSYVDTPMERFVYVAMQIPEARDMMKTISGSHAIDQDDDGITDQVVDDFGNPVTYRLNADASDPDNLPVYPRPFFASAGNDGEFGTDDDLFSYESD